MRTMTKTRTALSGYLLPVATLCGCNAIVGLDKLSLGNAVDGSVQPNNPQDGSTADPDGGADGHLGECTTNRQCTDRATQAALGHGFDAGAPASVNREADAGVTVVPAVCAKPEGRCVELLNADCPSVTGDFLSDDSILLGSLFSIKGAQSATNLLRQQSATLAIEEINTAGGIPKGAGKGKPLAMVSCDEATNLAAASAHLVTDLHVPAIVGPNTSQDTIDVSNKTSAQGGTLLLSPTAVASSIANLADDHLTWLMAPTDVQRADLMIRQINDIETKLRAERSVTNVKLALVYRHDALGDGTRTSLDPLVLNGKPLSDAINAANPTSGNVRFYPYDFRAPDLNTLVAQLVDFAPDIVVLAGTAEAITKVMIPLEQSWTADAGSPDLSRPYYMLIDSAKVPDLITAAAGSTSLRHRVRGTGLTPSPSSVPVSNAFNLDFVSRYGASPTASGTGPSYDSAYAIAYAIAANRDVAVTGANIAKGLRKLSGGATNIDVGGQKALAALQKLSGGESITATGTFGPLEWDDNGSVLGGTIEMWCIGAPTGTPAYQSSGLTFDIKTQKFSGSYTPCP